MLGNSAVVVVVRTRPGAIPLAKITMRKSIIIIIIIIIIHLYSAFSSRFKGPDSKALFTKYSTHGFPLSFPCMMSMGLRLAALRAAGAPLILFMLSICDNRSRKTYACIYLTIIPRARVGYEMIDSERGA